MRLVSKEVTIWFVNAVNTIQYEKSKKSDGTDPEPLEEIEEQEREKVRWREARERWRERERKLTGGVFRCLRVQWGV